MDVGPVGPPVPPDPQDQIGEKVPLHFSRPVEGLPPPDRGRVAVARIVGPAVAGDAGTQLAGEHSKAAVLGSGARRECPGKSNHGRLLSAPLQLAVAVPLAPVGVRGGDPLGLGGVLLFERPLDSGLPWDGQGGERVRQELVRHELLGLVDEKTIPLGQNCLRIRSLGVITDLSQIT